MADEPTKPDPVSEPGIEARPLSPDFNEAAPPPEPPKLTPTFNAAAKPPPPKLPPQPQLNLNPPQPGGSGGGQVPVPPQLPKDEATEAFKKKMLLKREFNQRSRGLDRDR